MTKSRVKPSGLDLAAQDAHAGRVEGRHPRQLASLAEQALDALAHLARRLVGEGDGEDAPRRDAALADQVRDAMRQRARLARAGAGEDQQRAVAVQDRLLLHRIERREEITTATTTLIVRCHGVASTTGAPGKPRTSIQRQNDAIDLAVRAQPRPQVRGDTSPRHP